jgi:hypothetical protein
MIITKLQGGLGNQMFQYAIARAIAEKNKHIFKLDLSFFPQQSLRCYELNQFHIIENIADKTEVKKLGGSNGLFAKALRKFGVANRPHTYYPEQEITRFDAGVFDYKNNIYLDGYWQNEHYFLDIRQQICQEFTPVKPLSMQAQKLLEQIEGSNSVSLHVRRGDYVSNQATNAVHGTCTLDYYKKAIGYIQQQLDSPKFFVFSDDMGWCKQELAFIPDKVFVDCTQTAIEDLELMKHCQHNIIANSSFSWWGAWLNQNNKAVVAPKKWINHNPNDFKWACDSWVQL